MRASDPERDRRLAQRARYSRRSAEGLDAALGGFFSSTEMQRMRRFQRVVPALQRCLPPQLLQAVSPVRLQEGALTLEVADSVAMHELRQHYAPALAGALAEAGTGVSRLIWRLAPRPRQRGSARPQPQKRRREPAAGPPPAAAVVARACRQLREGAAQTRGGHRALDRGQGAAAVPGGRRRRMQPFAQRTAVAGCEASR